MGFKRELIVEASAFDIGRDVYIPKILEAIKANLPEGESLDGQDRFSVLAAYAIARCSTIDPTYKGDRSTGAEEYRSGGPGAPMGSYTKTLLQWFLRGIVSDHVASSDHLMGLITTLLPTSLAGPLTQYDTNFKYMKGPEKNFSYFKTKDQFYAFMESEETQVFFASREGDIAKENSRVFYEDEDWTVVVPKTWQASKFFGKGTRWCTAWEDSSNYFNQFNRAGILLMCLNKGGPHNSYQLFASKDPVDEDQMAANSKDRFANLEIALEDTALLDFLKKNFEPALKMSVSLWTENLKSSSPRDSERYPSDLEYAYLGDSEEEEDEITYDLSVTYRVLEPYHTPLTEGTVTPSCRVSIDANKVTLLNGEEDSVRSMHSASFLVVTMPLQALDESCLQFEEVNFAAKGALIMSSWGESEMLDDIANNMSDDLEDIGEYSNLTSRLHSAVKQSLSSAFDKLGLYRMAYVIFSPLLRGEGPPASPEGLAELFGGMMAGHLLSEDNGDAPLLGTMAIGDDDREVAILYDADQGDLSDAMDDPKFKARMSKWIYHPGAARKAGQKEFDFSSRKVTP